MELNIVAAILVILGVLLLWLTKPTLNPKVVSKKVEKLNLEDLKKTLDNSESETVNLIQGTEAHIQFATPEAPQTTDLVFMYVHGFSATWKETDPVASTLAKRFGANLLQCRIAGHGTGPEGMKATAEDWIASLNYQAEIAAQLGRNIIIIGVSTGAPLAIWLSTQSLIKNQVTALLFMSPNFKIKPGIGALLTWPITSHLIRLLFAGRYRSWVPANEEQARFWTTRQPISALIEMQQVVDWANKQSLESIQIPLATMYMGNDPTVNSTAAIRAHNRFSNAYNKLIKVELEGDAKDHVFCGDICGPQRTNWTISSFESFLKNLPDEILTPNKG